MPLLQYLQYQAEDEWNDNFKYTGYFKEKKRKIISKFKKERLKLGSKLYPLNRILCSDNLNVLHIQYISKHIRYRCCFIINAYNLTFYKKKRRDNPKLKCIRKSKSALKENGVLDLQ